MPKPIYYKKIALLLLVILMNNILSPVCFALTSGPSQPEAQSFQQAGVSDMVDVFSGDFKYNIPLLDVDGYPINLNYQSGAGIDDEASWVGLGWNINVGAVNRSVRGLPDDMAGDTVSTDYYTKPKITAGGQVRAKFELFGKGKLISGNGSVSLGIFNDNYTGIGAELGANAGISVSFTQGGPLTSGLGLGILSNTSSGVSVSPSANLGLRENMTDKLTASAGLSASLGYNTRSGLKSLTLGTSFSMSSHVVSLDMAGFNVINANVSEENVGGLNLGGSTISFNTEPVIPRVQFAHKSSYNSFSLDGGYAGWATFVSGGFTGYKSVSSVASFAHVNPEYGFLYAERGKNISAAMMDFIREKENPVITDLPDLAMPVQMPDIFSFTNQADGGQFRFYRGGTGAFFDNQVSDNSSTSTWGADVGIGHYFHGGITHFNQNVKNTTRKWTNDNQYIKQADFQSASTTQPTHQHVYIKRVGEKSAEDAEMVNALHDTLPLTVNISGKTAINTFRTLSNPSLDAGTIQKTQRELNRTSVSYLTASEARLAGLEKTIRNYAFNDSAGFTPAARHHLNYTNIRRDTAYRKSHHISEITVTDDAGKRSVYGVPVYNISQEEYTFALGNSYSPVDSSRSQVAVDYNAAACTGAIINHCKGIDNYYMHERRPGYATSFLLSAILSPDYVDKTGNGITQDDLGTAIKFNYSKIAQPYKWRTPYHNASINKGQLADADDDKGSIIYGQKELWYLSTIETKTMIAYFITTDRTDDLGVNDVTALTGSSVHQKRLSEIRLYSKSDITRPIKIVKFCYGYNLCPGVPNSGKGKLTLTKVYFEYGNTTKGRFHPYVFTYSGLNAHYGALKADRWGIYKPYNDNGPFNLANDEFPYTRQDMSVSGDTTVKHNLTNYVSNWQLSQIDLPTGGTINVTYEPDDYAYVQNKRAMAMTQMRGLIKDVNGTLPGSLADAHGFKIGRQETQTVNGDPVKWFKDTYLNGSDYIYSKFNVKIATSNSYSDDNHKFDNVPCFAKVTAVHVTPTEIYVILEDRSDSNVSANPIIFSAWQIMKNEYPRYAYPGFDRRLGDNTSADVGDMVRAIVGAVGQLSELFENFYQKANRKKYCSEINPDRSYVRVTKVNGFKFGGGLRVKKIRIKDNWTSMSQNSSGDGSYGQAYDYTTTEDGKTISSGVASYEPTLGNDENPLRQPIPYVQSIKGAISNFYDLEEPFGESFFPAASVGYSKVTVTDLNKDGEADILKRTGYVVNEFYTAKDFPVRVHVNPLVKLAGNQSSSSYNFLGASSVQEAIYSQGYAVILNDMHGKPKANRIYNKAGAEISSTVYYYKSKNTGGEMELVNTVNTVDNKGCIKPEIIGRDVEFFTDFREQETQNSGQSLDLGVDVIPAFFFPIPIPHWPTYNDSEYKLFRSACSVKVSQYYGIVDKVVKTVNGSTITTQNLVYDRLTGEAVVTRTQNEFNKYIYSLNMPAYWVYKAMGGAYQNIGIITTDLQTDAHGVLSSAYNSYLQPGDELADLHQGAGDNIYWVAAATDGINRVLIDRNGIVKRGLYGDTLKIIRSGFRNMLGASTASIVSLNSPISTIGGKLVLVNNVDQTGLKVINASATTFDENWGLNYHPLTVTRDSTAINDNICFNFAVGASQTSYCDSTSMIIPETGPSIPLTTHPEFWGGPQPSHGTFARTLAIKDTSTQFNKLSTGVHTNSLIIIGGGGGTECSPTDYTCSRINDTIYTGVNPLFPLNRSGIWIAGAFAANFGEVMGFDKDIFIPASKIYYVGYGGDNSIRVTIDSVTCASESDASSYHRWKIVPVSLTAGTHKLHVEFFNRCVSGVDNSSNPATAGVEIYNNTITELQNAQHEYDLNMIFTTKSLRGATGVQSFRFFDGTRYYHYYTAQHTYYLPFNPYVNGFLGNWRPYQTKVFQQKRNYTLAEKSPLGINVKNAGYIDRFWPYWYYSAAANKWTTDNNPKRQRWVNANTVTLYDKYGQQLENKDALNRYSAANFDFNGELPAAVASNAANHEIYANSFEDVHYRSQVGTLDTIATFTQSSGTDVSSLIRSNVSHSGNYSLLLPSSGIRLTTNTDTLSQKTLAYFVRDTAMQYLPRAAKGLYPSGFAPYPNKQYIFNAWVKDNSPTNTTVPITLTAGSTGAPVSVTLKCKAIVEGWKLVEGTINMNAIGAMDPLTINISGNGIYIDDIRIHPYDALMKSYVYDEKTFKLMAELDENGFTTFYEYDDEGSLIRVKKETERGIMTIKESRSSYKRILP